MRQHKCKGKGKKVYDYSNLIALFKSGKTLNREEILCATIPRPTKPNVDYILSILDLPIWSPGKCLYKLLTEEDLKKWQ